MTWRVNAPHRAAAAAAEQEEEEEDGGAEQMNEMRADERTKRPTEHQQRILTTVELQVNSQAGQQLG